MGVARRSPRSRVTVATCPAGGNNRVTLSRRFDLRRATDAVSWGYGGSEPAPLGLALATDVLADDEAALYVPGQLDPG